MEKGLNKKVNRWPRTGVWWDLNTCPAPEGYNFSRVHPIIESALQENYAPGPVTIFAVGNLNKIHPDVLKGMSSNGILLRHYPEGGGTMLFDALCEWRELNPSPGNIMLISGDKSWCSPYFGRFGYTIRRAFPGSKPEWTYDSSAREWECVWQTLLKVNENDAPLDYILKQTFEPACFCIPCKSPMVSCDDFIQHLKTSQHASKPPELSWFAKALFDSKVWASSSPNEYGEPLLFCRLCNYSTHDLHNAIIHYYSEEHAQNRALGGSNATIIPLEGFNNKFYTGPKTTGVWWDLNTCPLPPGYDIGCVLPSVKSALKKLFYTGPITLFAIGNLDFVSAEVLKDISSSQIRLIHSPFGGGSEVFTLLREWRKMNPSPGNIMLISGNRSWYCTNYIRFGYTMLRAFPECKPAEPYGTYKEWVWETLLKENSGPAVEKYRRLPLGGWTGTVEPTCFCRLCQVSMQNCDDLIKHLKSRRHKQALWDWIGVDKNMIPEHFCKVCKYPALDNFNLTVHKIGEVHKLKAVLQHYGRAAKERGLIMQKPST